MNNGDVVFFKKAKRGSSRKSPEITFKGHGFGVLLGHVPPFQKDPPPEHLLRLMGTIGFMTFDMVAEFLGDEQAALCVKKFEDKFYGKQIPQVATPENSGITEVVNEAGLVGIDGGPLRDEESHEPTL